MSTRKRRRWAGSRAVPLEEAARRLGVRFDETARSAARRFPLRFPGYYLGLADASDPADPIRRIGWPAPEELDPDPGALDDPVGEKSRLVHPLVVQKHPDRVILLLTSRCHFYCRFCFRAGHRKDPSLDEVERAVDTLSGTGGVREVILSGGDPLVLPNETLAAVLRLLGRVAGVKVVRIHTRAPVHDPARVTDELVDTLSDNAPAPLWVAIHTCHPRELTRELERATAAFLRRGVPLLNQTVLLRGVNDDPATLAELFSGLYRLGVRPYYLHHPDRVAGTARFRVTVREGRQIYRALRRRLSGPAVPHYVIDLPDGSGKVPVDWLEPAGPDHWRVSLGDGRECVFREDGDAPQRPGQG